MELPDGQSDEDMLEGPRFGRCSKGNSKSSVECPLKRSKCVSRSCRVSLPSEDEADADDVLGLHGPMPTNLGVMFENMMITPPAKRAKMPTPPASTTSPEGALPAKALEWEVHVPIMPDVLAEVFSAPRVVPIAANAGLQAHVSLDLLSGWNGTIPSHRALAKRILRARRTKAVDY